MDLSKTPGNPDKEKKMKKLIVVFIGLLLLGCTTPVWGNEKIVSGLKEALNVGITQAVKLVGVKDGYFKNQAIKIMLPEKLKTADQTIRNYGGDTISDLLVEKMNRAAEQAAPKALDIFVDAIKGMKFDDAMKIFSGQPNAATEYLEKSTSDTLKKSFYPVVKNTMNEVNALKTYDEYLGKLNSGTIGQVGSLLKASPLGKSETVSKVTDIDLDINQYVTDKAIDGLFKMVGEQEKSIRENPEARVTSILKDVFGKLTK